MPQTKTDKGEASKAQNRFVISLPSELGAKLDKAGDAMSKTIADAHGFAPTFTRAQVIEGLVDGKLAQSGNGAEAPES